EFALFCNYFAFLKYLFGVILNLNFKVMFIESRENRRRNDGGLDFVVTVVGPGGECLTTKTLKNEL
ncbi:MAG: hypothetical protein RBR95_11100, partial [Ignavibacteriaceae bacterium]|nr:hypothetical protein [Ignavibacteriaceae bacterium]